MVLPLPATQEDGDPRVPLRGSPPLPIRTQLRHAGGSAGPGGDRHAYRRWEAGGGRIQYGRAVRFRLSGGS